jgi:hypothetical protein
LRTEEIDEWNSGRDYGVVRQKDFLKQNPVDGEAKAAGSLGGKQLCRGRITLKVSDDYVSVQKHQWPLCVRRPAILDWLGLGHLFYVFLVTTQTVRGARAG